MTAITNRAIPSLKFVICITNSSLLGPDCDRRHSFVLASRHCPPERVPWPKPFDYYHSLISPWSYLGGPRLGDIAAAAGATVNVKPIDLARVFPVSGGLPLAKRADQRRAYRLTELARWRDHLGMPLNIEPRYFPTAEGQGPLEFLARALDA